MGRDMEGNCYDVFKKKTDRLNRLRNCERFVLG
jgi:hypothetical protein